MSLEAPFAPLFLWTLLMALASLLVGGLLDSTVTELQGTKTSRPWCAVYFLSQLIVDIFLILVIARAFVPFLPWLQLTIAGVIASVVYFAVQQQMVNNALCLVSF